MNATIQEVALYEGDSFVVGESDQETVVVYAPQFPFADGCETILNYRKSGYSYHIAYTYWFRDEAFDDLMLEYSYWTNDGRQRAKAFYIATSKLYNAMKDCGIAVQWEATSVRLKNFQL